MSGILCITMKLFNIFMKSNWVDLTTRLFHIIMKINRSYIIYLWRSLSSYWKTKFCRLFARPRTTRPLASPTHKTDLIFTASPWIPCWALQHCQICICQTLTLVQMNLHVNANYPNGPNFVQGSRRRTLAPDLLSPYKYNLWKHFKISISLSVVKFSGKALTLHKCSRNGGTVNYCI